MIVDYDLKWYAGKKEELQALPNKILYSIASDTLSRSVPYIPLSKEVNSGNLRRTSVAGGVKGSNGNYYIGSYTAYAKRVWNLPSSSNWSTAGTNNKWYERVWKKEGKQIAVNVIERLTLK